MLKVVFIIVQVRIIRIQHSFMCHCPFKGLCKYFMKWLLTPLREIDIILNEVRTKIRQI